MEGGFNHYMLPLFGFDLWHGFISLPRRQCPICIRLELYNRKHQNGCDTLWFFSLLRRWSYVRHNHPLLPNAVLANSDRRMIAPALNGFAALNLPSHTPFSVFPHLIAVRTYSVRGIRIQIVVHSFIVAEMHILEHIFVMFLYGLPTVHWS